MRWSQAGAQGEEENASWCTPLVWDSVGLRAVTPSYPLKTSLEKDQLFGGIPCTGRAGFHVAFTRFR